MHSQECITFLKIKRYGWEIRQLHSEELKNDNMVKMLDLLRVMFTIKCERSYTTNLK